MATSGTDVGDRPRSGVWSIVVAGGAGLRFGARKQFLSIHGSSVLQRSVRAAAAVSAGVVVVVPADALETHDLDDPAASEMIVVVGGETRAESVRAGLAVLPADCSIVLVHDAARPLATTRLFESVVEAVEAGAEAVVPGVPIADTVRHRDTGVVDRSALVAVQTPQGFSAPMLRRAHESAPDATDDATLAESVGATVVVIAGEATNRKITDPVDLVAAAAIVEHSEDWKC